MKTFEKPVVVVSRCLEFAACRYDGQKISDPFVRMMRPFVKFVPVCPEEEIGLGTPRDPIKIVSVKGQKSLLQPSTGADVSKPMRKFAQERLDAVTEADGFLLKSRSPSCGLKDVKYYAQAAPSSAVGRGSGLFGEAVLARFSHLAVEDEARLNSAEIRHHYFTKLFCLAHFRKLKKSPSMKSLTAFHAERKFLFMCYDQTAFRTLGRIAANPERKRAADVFEEYQKGLYALLGPLPRTSNTVNALEHVFGFFSEELKPGEKTHFLALLRKYRLGKATLPPLLALLSSWAERFEKSYVQSQVFFEPYPEKLAEDP